MSMTMEKGWINRQLARVERDAQSWPEWMKREAEQLAQQHKKTAAQLKEAHSAMVPEAQEKAGKV